MAAYLIADVGTEGSSLIATAAQNLTGSNADYVFTVTGSSLVPGERLLLKLTSVATEGGNTGTTHNQINSIRVA